MVVILWEFEVKSGSEERFQRAYGPEGAWVQLFRRDPYFQGTQLLPDPSRPHYYFTLDFWDSENAYHAFLDRNREAYEELDRSSEGLTLRQRRILSFTLSLPLSPGP